jgi:sulfite exporter TauE/SafE
MTQLVLAWYAWLSQLAQGAILAIDGWIVAINVPMATAMLFGLIGATSPCQLTTNLGALAFSASQPERSGTLASALAYVSGKVMVYSVVGGLVILLGVQLQGLAVPVVVVARRLLGPLMLVVGLGMLGVIRLRGGTGLRWSQRLRGRLRVGGRAGAFLLGVAFSFAFCPTLFWLFFGLTVPLALGSAAGWSFPAHFALGTALPLLTVAALVSAGWSAADRIAGQMARFHRPVRWLAGAVFVLAGLHDTVVYWWL